MSAKGYSMNALKNTVLTSQMTRLRDCIHLDANEMFANLPIPITTGKKAEVAESEQKFQKYLSRELVTNFAVLNILDSLAIIGSTSAAAAFEEFANDLPTLTINSDDEVQNNSSVDLTLRFDSDKFKISSIYHRIAFNIYFDQVFCMFTTRLLLASKLNGEDKMEEIIKGIPDRLQKMITPLSGPIVAYNASLWSESMCLLSMVNQDLVFSTMEKNIPDPSTDSPISYAIMFNLYSQITFGQGTNSARIVDICRKYERIIKGIKQDALHHIPSIEWLLNISCGALVLDPSLRELPFIYDMSEIAKKFQGSSKMADPSEVFRAQVYAFSKHPKLSLSLDEYFSKYIAKDGRTFCAENASVQLRATTALILGSNYYPKFIRSIHHTLYKDPTSQMSQKISLLAYNLILHNNGIFDNCQVELAETLTVIAAADFQDFVTKKIKSLFSQDFLINNWQSVFTCLHTVISPASRFQELTGANVGLMSDLKVFVSDYISTLLDKIPTKSGNVVYKSNPLYDSLTLTPEWENIILPSNVDRKLEMCMYSMKDTNYAQPLILRSPMRFSAKDTKPWTSVLAKFFEQSVFESIKDYKLNQADIPPNELTQELIAISLIPFFKSETFIEKLAVHINIANPHISSACLRTLQALLIHNPQSAESVIAAINNIPVSTLEDLYNIIQAYTNVITCVHYAKVELKPQSLLALFSAIIAGLCTPTPALRSLAMNLAGEVSRLGNVKPNFLAFLDENTAKFNSMLRQLVITHGNFSAIDLTNIPEITFQSLVPTGYDSIYSCALSILGRIMAQSSIAVTAEQAIHSIVSIGTQIGDNCPLFLINVYIFVAAMTKGTAVNTKVFEVDELLQDPDKCGEHFLPFIAFYTSGFGIPIIKNVQPSTSFMSHVVSYTIRNMISQRIDGVEEFALMKFDHIISLSLKSEAFPKIPQFSVNQEYLKNNQHLIYSLCDIACCIRQIYNDLYQSHVAEAHGAFPRNITFGGEKLTSDQATRMFTFLINCASAPETQPFLELRSVTRSALQAFARVYTIPDSLFNTIKANLDTVAEISFSVLTSVLGSTYNVMLPLYIEKSIENPIFFRAITAQFMQIDSVDKFILKWKSNVTNEFTASEKEFNDTTDANLGGLIPLAFFMLTHAEAANRAAAINLLTCVSLGALLIRHDDNVHGLSKLIHRIQTFLNGNVTLPPEINVDLIVAISELLAKRLRPITEQVLSYMFNICKKSGKDSAVFISVMAPWMCGLIFNRDMAGIVPDINEKLIRFTGFSFLRRFVKHVVFTPMCQGHFKFIDAILDSKCEEMDIHEYFFICLYSIQQSDQTVSDNVIAVIDYLFTKDSAKVIEHISKFFTLRSWFYYQIQLLRMDIQFDMDRFMENLAHTGKGGDDSEEEDVSDIDLYQIVITFSSKLVIRLYKEKPEAIKPHLGPILLFCLLYPDQFEGAPKELLHALMSDSSFNLDIISAATNMISSNKTILATTPEQFTATIHQFSRETGIELDIILQAVDYIFSFSSDGLKKLAKETLRWATTCGEIKTAHRAIILYSLIATTASEEIIDVLLRTLHIFISVLTERTAPGWKSKKQQVLAMIMEKELDSTLAFNYIADLIGVITKISTNLVTPSLKAFMSVIQLLKVQREEQMDIFRAVINHISAAVSVKSFSGETQTQEDYLQLILSANYSLQTLTDTVNFLIKLPELGAIKCLTPSPYEALFLSVLPYIFSHRYESRYIDAINSFKGVILDIEISDLIGKLSNEGDDVIEKLVARVVKKIDNKETILSIINFYTNVLSKDQTVSIPIYKIVTIMLKMDPLPVSIDKFGGIGDIAASVTDPMISVYSIEFLKRLQSLGGAVMKRIQSRGMKQFPAITLPFSQATWEPKDDIDPFGDIKNLPPLAIIDIEYYGCEFLQPIQEVLPLIKVNPFTNWANATFKAENMHVQENMVELEVDAVTVKDQDKFFNVIEKALVNDDESDDEDANCNKKKKNTKSGNFVVPDDEDEEERQLEYSTFLPAKEEINNLGADILAGIDLPSFF